MKIDSLPIEDSLQPARSLESPSLVPVFIDRGASIGLALDVIGSRSKRLACSDLVLLGSLSSDPVEHEQRCLASFLKRYFKYETESGLD